MIRFLLDADCAVFAMTARFPILRERIQQHTPGEIAISVISYAEVSLGTAMGKAPPQDVLDAFVAAIPLLEFGAEAARTYARLPFKRARFDRLLAAHALTIDATIITNNERDFADVPGLRIENWSK